MRPAAKNTVCRFQSTLSVRRATAADLLALLRAIISIHALRKESDVDLMFVFRMIFISIHALRKESDVADGDWPSGGLISIHALRKESDPHGSRSSAPASTFQSTLSVRRATRCYSSLRSLQTTFQSTLSVRRATM